LLISQINYFLTNFADPAEKFSHDAANRHLAGDKVKLFRVCCLPSAQTMS